MSAVDAGRTGGLTRAAVHGGAQRREWASKGGRRSMGLEPPPDGVVEVVLVAGRLMPRVELDAVQRRALASLRGREMARLRWAKR